jgi:hypothetical protein
MYTHARVCASSSNFSSGNEAELENLAGRLATRSNVSLYLSVQQKERETACRKTRQKEKLKERKGERRNITINFPFLND